MSVWPLEADLFYLNAAGQVWKQPLLGDESAASAVTRLDVNVQDFAVAPGGEWLLYRTDTFVAVGGVNNLSGQLIADTGPMQSARMGGHTMAWSPDASKLAYTTPLGFEVYVPGAGPEFGPLVFPTIEQSIRELGWSHNAQWLLVWRDDGRAALYGVASEVSLWVEIGQINSYAWLSDGRLAFAPSEGGLALLDPGDLNSRAFLVRQDRQVNTIGEREDGSIAFFAHDNGDPAKSYLNLADPEDLSFRQESGVAIAIEGWEWNPTATRLMQLDAGDPSGHTVELLDPSTGSSAQFETSGAPVAFAWGDTPPRTISGIALPSNLYFIAPEAGVLQVWRLPKNGDPPATITDAATDVIDYRVSSDGTQIVYTSGGVIYRRVIGTQDITEIVTLASDARVSGTPAFSTSGRKIAYANKGIWVYDLDTQTPTRLVADVIPQQLERETEITIYNTPRWSPDDSWLIIQVGYYEGFDNALLSTTGSPLSPLPLNLFVTNTTWTSEGNLLVFSSGGAYSQPGLHVITPGETPAINATMDLPIADAELRSDGRLAFLRIPSPYGIGPTSVQLFSALATGGSPRAESGSFVLEQPSLSPNAVVIAGLIQSRYNEFGTQSGRLAIANPGTGEIFVIATVSNVRSLQWGN
jgi:hypothetical protein